MPRKKNRSRLVQLEKARQKEMERRQALGLEQSQQEDTSVEPTTSISASVSDDPTPSTFAELPRMFPSTSAASQPLIPAASTSSLQPLPSTSAASSPFLFDVSSAPSSPPTASTSMELPPLIIPLSTPLPPPQEITREITRSEKKMQLYQQYVTEDIPQEASCVRTVVEIQQIEKLLRDVGCPQCHSVRGLSLEVPRQYGLALKLTLVCRECGETITSHYTSSRNANSLSTPKPFVVNEVCVFASLLAGMGPISFKNFCEYMEMPGVHHKTFNNIASRIYSKNEALGEKVFSQACDIVRQEYSRQYHINLTDDDVLDISVSFDGSWLTRGHKSLVGIGSVIDVLTGLVLDVHVLSLHCAVCATTGDFVKRDTPHRYQRWRAEHIASGMCSVNFEGTSGMMEVKAAEVLWSRSVERHKLRYTTMVSDGDSKSYNRLLEVQPYGPDVTIDKEECLNHVGKRLGTALRNLVSDCSKRSITLGGRGHGRLTADAIRKLQIYYSRAIRGNKSAEDMRKAIYASIYHGYSTDDLPQHQYCPPGPSSWCFYKKSIGEHLFPTGHKKRVHTPLDYDLLHKHLEPLYKRLTSDDLLKRCELKATQNPNESFHHSVWSRCSKKNFHSLKRVQFAVISAAAEYNRGPEAISSIKKSLGMKSGLYGTKFGKARENKRLQSSILQATQRGKERRKLRAAAKEKARQEKEAEEGGPAYQAGMF